MRAYHVAAFAALLFWQSAPVQVVSAPGGRYRISVAGSAGEWEDYQVSYDCDGNKTSETSVEARMRSLGARADAFLGEGNARVTVVGGRTTSEVDWVGHGTFWGAMLALEGRTLGAGFGFRHAGDALLPQLYETGGGDPGLALYLRGGKLDRLHSVLELRPLSETPSLAGEARVGLAFGQGRQRQASGFFGVVIGPQGQSGGHGTAGFGELGIPLGPSVDVLLRAVYGPGHLSPHLAGGAGLRLVFGR